MKAERIIEIIITSICGVGAVLFAIRLVLNEFQILTPELTKQEVNSSILAIILCMVGFAVSLLVTLREKKY